MDNVVHKSVLSGPNGEFMFDMAEDVTGYDRANTKIRNETGGFSESRDKRMLVSVPPRLYYWWANKLGEECWQDPAFLRSFIKENPQYSTCNGQV